jgi:hypothetical protein
MTQTKWSAALQAPPEQQTVARAVAQTGTAVTRLVRGPEQMAMQWVVWQEEVRRTTVVRRALMQKTAVVQQSKIVRRAWFQAQPQTRIAPVRPHGAVQRVVRRRSRRHRQARATPADHRGAAPPGREVQPARVAYRPADANAPPHSATNVQRLERANCEGYRS